jgi:hypothetical protein
MQHGEQPFWARLQLLAGLTLNTRYYAANQPARLAQLLTAMIVLLWWRVAMDLLKSVSAGSSRHSIG